MKCEYDKNKDKIIIKITDNLVLFVNNPTEFQESLEKSITGQNKSHDDNYDSTMAFLDEVQRKNLLNKFKSPYMYHYHDKYSNPNYLDKLKSGQGLNCTDTPDEPEGYEEFMTNEILDDLERFYITENKIKVYRDEIIRQKLQGVAKGIFKKYRVNIFYLSLDDVKFANEVKYKLDTLQRKVKHD
jgi:hypothetical protein